MLTEIEVGMAMDNDNKDKSYIIDEKKLMCWHDSEKDEKGYFRSIDKNSGNYGHAPFQLGITKARKAESDFTLVVTGELIKGSHFNLELFDQNTGQYQLLKTLEDTAPLLSYPGDRTYSSGSTAGKIWNGGAVQTASGEGKRADAEVGSGSQGGRGACCVGS